MVALEILGSLAQSRRFPSRWVTRSGLRQMMELSGSTELARVFSRSRGSRRATRGRLAWLSQAPAAKPLRMREVPGPLLRGAAGPELHHLIAWTEKEQVTHVLLSIAD